MGSRLDPPVQDLDHYRPARFAGEVLRLHYARPADLGRYRGMVAAEGEAFVRFWLKPGDPAVELTVGAPGEAEAIPAELRGGSSRSRTTGKPATITTASIFPSSGG